MITLGDDWEVWEEKGRGGADVRTWSGSKWRGVGWRDEIYIGQGYRYALRDQDAFCLHIARQPAGKQENYRGRRGMWWGYNTTGVGGGWDGVGVMSMF